MSYDFSNTGDDGSGDERERPADRRATDEPDANAPTIGRRSVLQKAGAGLAAAGLGSSTAFAEIETDRETANGELSTTAATRAFDVGAFTVTVVGGENPRIVVDHPDSEGPLWATNPGENVLAAARVDVSVEESRGSYTITEEVQAACSTQTIPEARREDGDLVLAGRLSGDGIGTDYELRFAEPSTGHLRFEASLANDDFDRVTLRYSSTADERCYGFGEQPSVLDCKGEEVPVVAQEGGIGRGHPIVDPLMEVLASGSSGGPLTTYAAIPYYLSDRGYSLFLENTAYSAFDLTSDERSEVRALSTTMTGRILAGETPLDRIERFTEYTGRMDPLPAWFHEGAVIGMQGGTERVRAIWSELRERDTPVSAFWLQDWVGSRDTIIGKQLWWNWELDEGQYPGWDRLRTDLDDAGVDLLGYINPYLADPTEKGEYDRNLYQEAVDQGYVVETESGDPYTVTITDFPSAIVDLSNPDAREWYRSVIRDELLGVGLRGWMADFGEALPFEAELHDADPDSQRAPASRRCSGRVTRWSPGTKRTASSRRSWAC